MLRAEQYRSLVAKSITKFLKNSAGRFTSTDELAKDLAEDLLERMVQLEDAFDDLSPEPALFEKSRLILPGDANGKPAKAKGAVQLPEEDLSVRVGPVPIDAVKKNFTIEELETFYTHHLPPIHETDPPGFKKPLRLHRRIRRQQGDHTSGLEITYFLEGADPEAYGCRVIVSENDPDMSQDRVLKQIISQAWAKYSPTPIAAIQPRMPAPVGSLEESLRNSIGTETDRETSVEDMEDWKKGTGPGLRAVR